MKTVTITIIILMAGATSGAAETATDASTRAADSGAATAPMASPGVTGTATGTGAGVHKSGTAPAGTAAGAAAGPGAAVVPDDQMSFMMKAATSGLAEVQLARLALERSQNPDVRGHAQHMLDDHSKANETLRRIAQEKNVPLPDQLTGVHQQMVEKLRTTDAGKFDEAYMKAEVEEHKAAVALFRTEKESGKDARLQSFAAETLPTLERHLAEASQVTNKIAVPR